jgi:dimethylaniline monooxygenase (N-oxide forming)
MDALAEEIGVRPNLLRLARSDPWLSLRCFFGACIPAQYRLQGPGKWSGAREAIFRSLSNNAKATKSRALEEQHQALQLPLFLILTISVAVTLFFAWTLCNQ